MNAVGTEWITPGFPRMTHECSGYGMDYAWATEDTVGTEWITPGLPRMTHECSGYGMDHAWVTEDDS